MSLQQLREKIVNEIPISELIQRYGIHLTRKSTGHVGVCPFHQDSNPSMSVSDDKRIYKCFACGAGTTHFDFVMNLANLSFVEALKDICEKFGIDFDSYTDKKEKPQHIVFQEKISKAAAEIYHQIATKSQPEEFKEFVKNREVTPEVIESYKLGYAPKKNTILEYIQTLPKKVQEDATQAALKVGLIKPDRNGRSYFDTFRERIIFPIWDHYGKIIGVQTRATKDYQKAKYMNSVDSDIFKKRDLLYGLNLAKPFIRKKDFVLIMEGNMDQVTAYKKGFENSVAIMGVALGTNSLRTIKSLTKNVVLSLDTDNAGWVASERVNKQLLEVGIIPKYISFEPHKDPDDFLTHEGAIAYQTKIDEARPFIDVQFEKILPEAPIDLIDTKLALLQDAFAIVAPLKKDLRATERLIKWAERLGLKSSSDKILEDYDLFLNKNTTSQAPKAATPNAQPMNFAPQMDSDAPPFDMEPPPSALAIEEAEIQEYLNSAPPAIDMPNDEQKISKVEETLILTLIEYPDCLEYDELSDLLDFMGSDRVKDYILRLRELIFEIDIKEFKNFAVNIAKDFELETLASKAIGKYTGLKLDKEKAKKMIVDLEKKLIKDQLREKKAELRIKRNNVRTEEELMSLMVEIHKIEKKLYSLK
jgi:DNA primase